MKAGIVRLLEHAAIGPEARVDRAAHTIRNCRILGEKSLNGPPRNNYYPRSTREAAIRVFEGARVCLDHPAATRASQPRSYAETLGRIRNVREDGSGLRGDFVYNPKHHLAEQMIWDAENEPGNLSFSINADGVGHFDSKAGHQLIEAIPKCHSVDLVSQGATTRSLFEARSPTMPETVTLAKKKTLREAIAGKLKPAWKKLLLEMDLGDDSTMDQPADDVPGAAGLDATAPMDDQPDHGDDLMSQICDLVKSAGDADSAVHNPDYLEDLKTIQGICDKYTGDSSASAMGDESEDGVTAKEGKLAARPAKGQVRLSESARLREEIAVRDLVEEAGLSFPKAGERKLFLKSLVPLAEAERKELIAGRAHLTEQASKAAPASKSKAPRSQQAGAAQLRESREVPKDAKGFADSLFG